MKEFSREKLILSFVIYSASLVVCSVLASYLLFSNLFANKVSYMKYSELEKSLKGHPDLSQRFISISKYILPTVVNVTSEQRAKNYSTDSWEDFFRDFFNGPRNLRSSGSGFVIDGEGHIVTNYHVVAQAKELYVTFINHKTVKAEVIGADPKMDIALIRIASPRDLQELKKSEAFQVAELGTSSDLQVGEMVLAVGNPFALSHSVSMGIISAVGRSNVGISDYENFIQTDAAVNPGNSGGPLVSVRTGKVIGINTAILSKSGGFQGIAFTIPIDWAKKAIQNIQEKGKVVRGYLGVSLQDITPEIAQMMGIQHEYGALVRKVYPRSPAEKAGIRTGDLIIELGGQKMENVQQLRNQIALSPVGKNVEMKVDRRGKVISFTATLQDQDASLAEVERLSLGLEIQELTAEAARRHGLNSAGLIVSRVKEGSLAAQSGLKPGQIILSVNGKGVKTLQDFEKAIAPFQEGKPILIEGMEGDEHFYTLLRK